jgi:hypothetical protein
VGFARSTVAVLVGLDLHECGLGRPVEAGETPRVRIGLLALVRRAVDRELLELAPARVRGDERRERRACGLGRDSGERSSRVGPPDVGGSDRRLRSERGFEGLFQSATEAQHFEVPLEAVVDANEAPVREVVAAVQGEVEVIVHEWVGVWPEAGQRPRSALEHREKCFRERAVRVGETWGRRHGERIPAAVGLKHPGTWLRPTDDDRRAGVCRRPAAGKARPTP